MQEIRQIGSVPWDVEEIKNALPDFLQLYKERPIQDNKGGMKAPHLLATWFMIKRLNPSYVIESGVWKGLGTWLIQKAVPDAKIFSIDLDLSARKFVSEAVTYYERDFCEIDWSPIKDKKNTLLFFDDHQNAFERIRKGKDFGFKHFIFEDNYPSKRGDCYSLKKALQHAGFRTEIIGLKGFLKQILLRRHFEIPPNTKDAKYLEEFLDVYYEFPPLVKKPKTRWGDSWNEKDYPTPSPVFELASEDCPELFLTEALYYTWICYARLK